MNCYFKTVGIILIFAILLQGCAVYQRESVSIDQAAKTNHRILLVRNNDLKVKLKRIEQVDGVYYGIIRKHGQKVKIALDEKDIKKLRPINRTATTIGNVGFITLGVVTVVVIIFALTYEPMGDFNLGEGSVRP